MMPSLRKVEAPSSGDAADRISTASPTCGGGAARGARVAACMCQAAQACIMSSDMRTHSVRAASRMPGVPGSGTHQPCREVS